MISRIKLSHFKAHESLDIVDIPSIALIVGKNNSGKSSVLQAATLPKYGFAREATLPIGTPIRTIHMNHQTAIVELHYDGVADFLQIRINANGSASTVWSANPTPDLETRPRSVYYISSHRRVAENFQYEQIQTDVGIAGEHTWNILHQLKSNDDKRFGEIIKWLEKMNLGISSIMTPTEGGIQGAVYFQNFGSRANVLYCGSGVWSILPIITQGVLCDSGDTILVEEPESHLHRATMESLWRFMGECSNRGIQFICTTHSMDFLVLMNKMINKKSIPLESSIYHLRRTELGRSSVSKEDPSVFKRIEAIRDDLVDKSGL